MCCYAVLHSVGCCHKKHPPAMRIYLLCPDALRPHDGLLLLQQDGKTAVLQSHIGQWDLVAIFCALNVAQQPLRHVPAVQPD